LADIFEEVEEGIRQDLWQQRWQRYRVVVYVLVAMLIGGTGLGEYLRADQANRLERNSTAYDVGLNQLEAQDYRAAETSFQNLVAKQNRLSPAAGQMLAEVYYSGFGDLDSAVDVMSSAVNEAALPTEKLALIKLAYLQADQVSLVELEELLAPVTVGLDAFGALAAELLAMKALAEGDIEYARQEFDLLLISGAAPNGVRQRASQALSLMPASIVIDPELDQNLQDEEIDQAVSDPEQETE